MVPAEHSEAFPTVPASDNTRRLIALWKMATSPDATHESSAIFGSRLHTGRARGGYRLRRLKAFAISASRGLIPGAILILLAVPVSGEIELTLGAFGIQLRAMGFLIGGLVEALKA